MEEKKQNKELQSRREFFKNAAKKALPVIGAIALASSPIIAQAATKEPMGCDYGCSSSCSGGCKGGCERVCNSACVNTCKGGCQGCKTACTTCVNNS